MKKTKLLHPELSYLVATLGHKDMLVIGDAGLPIPPETTRIDLALSAGVPSFLQTLEAVLSEMQVESIILANETGEASPEVKANILRLLPDTKVEYVTHEDLKGLTSQARAVVRTGEFTPYANVILVSGVVF